MTLNELYNLANYIVKVTNKGQTLTPNKFEELWNRRQIDYFNEIYYNYESTTAISDTLRPFKVIIDQDDITVIGSAYFALPSNYFHLSGISYVDSDGKYYPFDVVTKSEAIMRKSSTLTLPTTTYPICYEFLNNMYLEPYDNTLDLSITYLKYPSTAILDYYITATGVYTYLEEDTTHTWANNEYDSNGSERSAGSTSLDYDSTTTEPEWNDDDKLKVLEYILRDVGVSIDQVGIYEYANIQKNES
jgi:hypothetical protein